MACPWGTTLVPWDLKGFRKPKSPVLGGHPSPWGHLQTLGILRDMSCPWGTPLLHKTPKGYVPGDIRWPQNLGSPWAQGHPGGFGDAPDGVPKRQ